MYEWKLTFALLTKNADACEAVRAVKAHPDFRHVFTGTLPQAGQWDSDDAPEAVLQTDAAVAANAADDKRREAAQAEDGGDGLASANSSSESGNGGEDEKCATDIGIKMHERLIVLADCDDPATLKAAVTQRGARVTVVAVAPLDAQLNEELYALCDAVWRLDPGLVEFRQRLGELLERLAFEREARLKQIWLLNLIDASPDLIWVKDLQGAHLEVNSTFCRTVNKSRETIHGRGHYFIWDIDPEEYAKGEFVCVESDVWVVEQKRLGIYWEDVKIGDEMRKFRTWKAPVVRDDGAVMGSLGIAKDVTDVLNLSVEMTTLLDSLPYGILLTDENLQVRRSNTYFMTVFGLPREEIEGHSVNEVMDKVLAKGWYYTDEFHHELSRSDGGASLWMDIKDRPVADVFGKDVGHFFIYDDITTERERALKLLNEAHTDPLTGLFNRGFFTEQVPLMRTDCRSDGIFFIDLDKFKHLNDVYGHDEGDRALITVAEMMRREFKSKRAVLSRLGGDEFLIYFKNQSADDLIRMARDFAGEVRREFDKSETMRGLSCSIGIAYTQDHNVDLKKLVRQADIAMYQAKRSGSGMHMYEPSDGAQAEES